MVDYNEDGVSLIGLKAGDGKQRGVPEGSLAEWLEITRAMREGREEDVSKRLAYSPEEGIYSPRNTNEGEYFETGDADLIESLLKTPQPWREDNLKTPTV